MLEFHVALAGKLEKAADDFFDALNFFHDGVQVVHQRAVVLAFHGKRLDVAGDDVEGIEDFVAHARGQAADAREFFRTENLLLRGLQFPHGRLQFFVGDLQLLVGFLEHFLRFFPSLRLPVQAQGVPDGMGERFGGEFALGEVIGGAGLHGFDGDFLIALPGEENDGDGDVAPAHRPEKVDAVHLAQAVIEQAEIVEVPFQPRFRLRGGGRVIHPRQRRGHALPDQVLDIKRIVLVVFHQENVQGFAVHDPAPQKFKWAV